MREKMELMSNAPQNIATCNTKNKTQKFPLIFLPRHSLPLINTHGMITLSSEHFKIREDKEVVINYPPLGITTAQCHLKEILKKSIDFGSEGVLQAYSNAYIPTIVEINSGVFTPIDIEALKAQRGIDRDYVPFATHLPTGIMGDVSKGEHSFPYVFHLGKDSVLIGSSSYSTHPKEKVFKIGLNIYFYRDHGLIWQEVLYKSLYEYALRNYNMSLVLLFSAIDIYTKSLNTPPHKITDRLRNLGLNNCIKKRFEKKIAKVRNDFEHNHNPVSSEKLKEAYMAAFEVIWELSTQELK